MGKSSSRSTTGKYDFPYFRAVWNRLVGTMLAIAFIPLLLLGGGLYWFMVTVEKEKSLENLKVELLERAISVDRYLERRILDLRQLGGGITGNPIDSGSLNAALMSLMQIDECFTDLAVVDPEGRCLGFAGPEPFQETDFSKEDWFRKAAGEGFWITDVFIGLHDEPHFLLAVSVRSADGQRIIRSTVKASRISVPVSEHKQQRYRDAFLVNQEGIFQTQPRSAGRLMGRSPVEQLEKFEGIRMEETGGAVLVKTWQERVPWMNVVGMDHREMQSQLKKVYAFAFLAFIIFAVPVIGIVLLTANDLTSRLEAKRSSLKVLDRQLRRASYMSSSMEMSMSCFKEVKDIFANIDITAMVVLEDPLLAASPDLRDSLGGIRDEVDRGQRSVERFLQYIEPKPPLIGEVSVHKMLDDLLGILERELRFRNIEVQRSFLPDLPVVHSDCSKLRQVFLNILLNALEAVGQNGEIELIAGSRDSEVFVEIRDNGPGIPETDLEMVFEPLWTTRPHGTGLGLPLCRDILDKLGGSIAIESTVGKGTSVIVTIPLQLYAQAKQHCG